MNDFILSIAKNSEGFIVTASSGEQVSLEPGSLSSLSADESGRQLYQWIFSDPIGSKYQERVPDRLLVYVPFEALDWPWQLLHDDAGLLVLRHPIVLLPVGCRRKPAPPLTLNNGPLRILLTLAPDEQHAALGTAIEKMIDEFARRHRKIVRLTKEPQLNTRRLLDVFQDALKPFHLWHHVGPCEPDFALKLADAAPNVHNLNSLPGLQENLRCFVLSTHQPMPAASVLSRLNVRFLLCQSALSVSTADLSLLQGFYDALLTDDLAVAATARLKTYLVAGASEGRLAQLTMLARTPNLSLGSPSPVSPLLPPQKKEQPPVRILFLQANPGSSTYDHERLHISQEIQEIRSAIEGNRHVVDLREESAVRFRDFSRHLLNHRPMLLHFSGHASDLDGLVFEKYTDLGEQDAGTHLSTATVVADPIAFSAVAGILAAYRRTLRCVVFNACHTELLAEAICSHIDCAIGMRGAINDGPAVRFSGLFYRGLAHGDSVGQAFHKAQSDIASRYPRRQVHALQLKCKPGVDPDTIVFVQTQGDRL